MRARGDGHLGRLRASWRRRVGSGATCRPDAESGRAPGDATDAQMEAAAELVAPLRMALRVRAAEAVAAPYRIPEHIFKGLNGV